MDSIIKARSLLVENTILLLRLVGIVEIKLSLSLWGFRVSVFPSHVPPLFSTRQKRKIQSAQLPMEKLKFLPKSFWNTFSISIFRTSGFLGHLSKSWDCLFICFPVSELTVIVLLEFGTKWHVQSYDSVSHVIPWQNKTQSNSGFN